MGNFVGIRHEDKYLFERRAPLIPRHVELLIKSKKLDFVIQESAKRIFTADEYRKAGARIAENLDDCGVILGVKEMPLSFFRPDKTYVFFAHVAKGQPYNMPMLRRMMELRCNLIDYEKIIDEMGKRLVFFGRYAGLAGMINSLWALGLRLQEFGFETPFLKIRQAHTYASLQEAKHYISLVGEEIAENGLPVELGHFTVAFTGYGNVSQGAQEILGLLPVMEIRADQLPSLDRRDRLPLNLIYKVIFKEGDLAEPVDPSKSFDLHEYYEIPRSYRSRFEQFVPHISLLMNCVYWNEHYPRFLTRDYLKKSYRMNNSKLIAVGDLSCDIHGAIECNVQTSLIEEPLYVFNPETDEISNGYKGEGLLMMAVDILPAELPRDSSNGFSDVLMHFVKPIADCDFNEDFEDLDLPRPLKRALILHKGELTPDFAYLGDFVKMHSSPS